MNNFKNNQRVLVRKCEWNGPGVVSLVPPAAGTVRRLRRADDGAFVELDHRNIETVHPFPVDDPAHRSNHVLTYPEFCEPTQ